MLIYDVVYYLQPLLRSYEDYNAKIDEVNELGNTYDALQRGEASASPIRRSESKPSPIAFESHDILYSKAFDCYIS